MIELYKKPDAVFSAINYGTRLVWLYTLGGGLLTYGLLLCLVHIRERIRMAAQRQRVTQEHFATMGEVSNDAAHAIRQPLDLIRAFA